MFKGCQKKVLMLKNTGSYLFEEAYFILKELPAGRKCVSESDMIKEANRIISENLLTCQRNKPSSKRGFLGWFAAGAGSAGAVATLLLAIIK